MQTPATVTIKGREYTVQAHDVSHLPRLHATMTANGWVPASYLLTGKRGATYHAQRVARTGEFVIIGKI